MFLTTSEATLIGVGIGSVTSWLVLIGTRRKDHQERIWGRTTDLYEHVLFEAAIWAATRDKLMRTYRLSGPDREIPTLDLAERQRTQIRLGMFGHRDVQAAFDRCADAHWRWAGCAGALQAAYDHNKEAMDRGMPEDLTSQTEIAQLRNERNTANQVAAEQHDELRRAIEGAVRRVPKPDRWFRRAPRATGRRIRDAWRRLQAGPDDRQRRKRIRDR